MTNTEKNGKSHYDSRQSGQTDWGSGAADAGAHAMRAMPPLRHGACPISIGAAMKRSWTSAAAAGPNLHRMSAHITTGHLTGVDYSATSVQTSRQTNADDIAAGKMTVCEGSVEALPFTDQTFDKITTVESFYFWPKPPEKPEGSPPRPETRRHVPAHRRNLRPRRPQR